MSTFVINGKKHLQGEVEISGAKNAALGILPATLLVEGKCRIKGIPDIADIKNTIEILRGLGTKVSLLEDGSYEFDSSEVCSYQVRDDLASKMRASVYVLGALLGRLHRAESVLPGGCDFGIRPINLHLQGFRQLGADVTEERGRIMVEADKLTGASIFMDTVSVGATINMMLAAVKAEGKTTIENAAKEPHVVDVANFLNAMGARIKGAGTDTIKITGVETLRGGYTHNIIPDQIEAGTFMVAAAATGGNVLVKNVIPTHMEPLTAKLQEMNVKIIEGDENIRVIADEPLTPTNVKTMPHPGFPTDLQPIIATLMCIARGESNIYEGVWDNRFQYVDDLRRMGAKITLIDNRRASIQGVDSLWGSTIRAHDLRAGAAMVIAALAADGETVIRDIKYIDRGYEKFEEKLRSLGADIVRRKAEDTDD